MMSDYPVIILSHRKREFLETAVASLTQYATNMGDVIVVDDSGDDAHHDWLLSSGIAHGFSSPNRSSVGYLMSMHVVWEAARRLGGHAMIWEEDFVLTEPIDLDQLGQILDENPRLAQVNLQRQAVYKIERRLGYMQSHQRRGYGLSTQMTRDIPWVKRLRPFTTNPGLIQREVFLTDWPSRVEADAVAGGAEPAMSQRLEALGYHFGWLGRPNHPQTEHVGTLMKSGKGY